MILIVRCNKCGHNQKVAPRISVRSEVSSKSKRCVYCGFAFKIHSSFSTTRIVKELPIKY